MTNQRKEMIDFYMRLCSDKVLMEEVANCIDTHDYKRFQTITHGFKKDSDDSFLASYAILEDDSLF